MSPDESGPKQYTARDLGKCAFCGAQIAADVDDGGLIHGLPACKKFLDLEPADFLKACREKLSSQKN